MFFAGWLGGGAVFVAAFLQLVLFRRVEIVVCLSFYYSYRSLLVPRAPWPWMHRLQASIREGNWYFKAQSVTLESPVPADDKRLLCYHPHGILCCGWSINGTICPELFDSKIAYLGADALFYMPFVSDMLSWYSCGPATKGNMKRLMAKGTNCALLPGGFQEATLYRSGRHRVYLKKRAGFVKYALQHGFKLTPVYCFGEEKTYWAFSWLQEKLIFLNKFNFPTVIFLGKWGTFVPDPSAELHTVVGPPLQLPTIASPTKEEVAEWHGKYVKALEELFLRHRDKYAPGAELEVL